MALLNTASHTTSSIFAPLERALTDAKAAWQRHREYRRTLNALESLSDRELDDLGIGRGRIREIAKQSVQ